MYLPKHFEVEDERTLWAFMRAHPFALLVTAPGGAPFATPLPLTVDEAGRALTGHVARANPQWRHLEADGCQALVVFSAEHALVSSRLYERGPQVPTWNYATVHAHARARLLSDDETAAQLGALMADFGHADDLRALPEDDLAGMRRGVVGFELAVTRLEGKFKLSQNKSPADRRRVAEALERGDALERGVAARMRALEPGGEP